MSFVLLVLGIVVAASGVAAIGFGIPLNEFTLGTTLMVGGTTALTGGFILLGLSAVVGELGRLAEELKRTAVRPQRMGDTAEGMVPMASAAGSPLPVSGPGSTTRQPPLPVARARPEVPVREMRPTPAAASPSSVEVSAAAIERLRSSIPRVEGSRVEPALGEAAEAPLSPNGAMQPAPAPHIRPEAVVPEPMVAPQDRGEGSAVEALKSSRLDFLFRSRPVRPMPPPQNFDAIWSNEARAAKNAPVAPAEDAPAPPVAEQPTTAQVHESSVEPAPEEAAPSPAILKSGVVDGMAYTLYADGSIEAKLPEGTVRFGSVAELRAHIESKS
jgi:hypothetical protein